jgi:hypothetical protein
MALDLESLLKRYYCYAASWFNQQICVFNRPWLIVITERIDIAIILSGKNNSRQFPMALGLVSLMIISILLTYIRYLRSESFQNNDKNIAIQQKTIMRK